jgi:uncharacterized protein (DUF58 family)
MELVIMALILTAVLVGQYIVYSKLGLKNLSYTLTISVPEAFEGDEIEIIEEIENAKALPLPWIRTEISCSRYLSFHGQQKNADTSEQRGLISGIILLKGHQKCRRVWRVKCEKRGICRIYDASVSVSDLFGLAKPAMVFASDKSVRVLPSPADLETGELSAEEFIGDMQVKRFVLPDPFVICGAKEYTGREPMNRIHWAQTARTGALMAYNNEFTTERRILVLLNMQRSYHSTEQRLSSAVLEPQIKAAAFVLDYCRKTGAESALVANSRNPLFLESAGGYEHTMSGLRQLAELKNRCGEHIDDFFAEFDFAPYTDIVFISGFLTDKTAEILRRLGSLGKGCVIFSTDVEDTDFCEVRHIPRGKHYPDGGDDE